MSFCKSGTARIAAIWMMASGLAACATAPPARLDAATASRIRTVALLDIAEPTVDLALNAGRSNESHSSSYAQTLSSQQIEFSPLLGEAITRRLEDSNYQVVALADQRPLVGADGSIDLSAVHTDADAILVVRFLEAGYVSPSTEGLQPSALVDVRLFDSRSRQRLYSRTFTGGAAADTRDAVHLPTDPRFRFASADQLIDKLEDSASGIKDAELAIASAVGRDFAVGSRPLVADAEPAPEPPAPQTTAAERDRLAAAALAAQWAAQSPAPTATAPAANADQPAAEAAAANIADAAPQAPLAEPQASIADTGTTQTAAGEPVADAPIAEPPQATVMPEAAEPAPPPTAAVPEAPPEARPVAETVATAVDRTAGAAPVMSAQAAETPPASASLPSEAATDAPPAAAAPASAIEPPAPIAGADSAAAPLAGAEAMPPARVTTEAPDRTPPAVAAPSAVLQHRTPVRVSPTVRAAIVAVLPAGASVTPDAHVIHNASGNWCYITSGTLTGWIPTAALDR